MEYWATANQRITWANGVPASLLWRLAAPGPGPLSGGGGGGPDRPRRRGPRSGAGARARDRHRIRGPGLDHRIRGRLSASRSAGPVRAPFSEHRDENDGGEHGERPPPPGAVADPQRAPP